MASGSQSMTTYYAKRIVGDASAAQANSALLQTGANVTANTWILNRTNRVDTYGIKYVYDTTTTTVHNNENDEDITTNNGQDKIEFYGGSATASAWIQLNTGDTYISGKMGIGGTDDSYKLYVNGSARIDNLLTLYREGSTTDNKGTGIQFENKDTTTNQIQTAGKTYILAYNTHSADDNGMNMVIRPGGNLFIGSGESAEQLYSLNTTSTTENLYATADSTIYLEANANTIANRIGIAIDDDGTILPVKAEADNNNAQNIGTDATRWKTGYFSTSLLVGAANSATAYNSDVSGSVITDGTISICRTTAGGGYYLYANGVQYGRLYISALGTANSGDDYTTRGAQGLTSLYLGNDIARPAAGTEGGANNSRGYIYLYHTDDTYTKIDSGSWTGHNLTVIGTTNGTANETGTSMIIIGNSYKKSAAEASSTGYLRIFGDEQYYHNIYPGASTDNHTHYLPNASGWIVTGGNGTNTGEGDIDTPVYLKTDGTLEAITSYDGNSATATALTSNAGGGEQPIYFTGGKPAATSYALKATVNNSTSGYMAYYSGDRAISGTSNIRATSAGALSIFPTGGSYRDGIRIHARSSDSTWAAILLCGADNTGDSGTSANSWFIGNTGGNLYFGRNGTGGSGTFLRCVDNVWAWNGTASGSISGNAATATNADKVDNYHASDLWRKDGGTWNGNANIACTPTANNQEYSFDLGNAYTGTYWHVWSGKNSASILQCYNDNRHVIIPVHLAVGGYNNTSYALSTASFICNSWIRTKGSTGWYNEDYGGGWYMTDAKWNRSYGSKPVLIDIGTNNAYGIGGHRLALGLSGSSHTSILLKGGDAMYGFCVNNDGHWYFGRRTSKSFESTSGDAYLLYGESTTFYPYTDNSVNLGASSHRWKTCYAVNFYGALTGNVTGNCSGSAGSVAWANVSSKPATATRWPAWSEVTSKPSTFAPSAHTEHTSIELRPGSTSAGHGGFIDFHFNNSSADYTSRIIEWSSGTLTVYTNLSATKIYNAVWNDFAEYRESDIYEGGRVLVSNGSGKLVLSTERLQPTAHVVSDTFGCSVGQSDTAKTPIGVAGRVLAYTYQDRNNYKVGDAVCAAPNGTIDIMTREEIIQYPDRIIGIVDEIPTYEIWHQVSTQYDGNGNYGGHHEAEVEVKNRIWIYVR